MICTSCGTENKAGRKFCANCGAALLAACPSCGAANDPGDRFCGDCGAALGADVETPASAARPERVAERRLVAVLFADLVGFTTLSEARDAEEVRELLSRSSRRRKHFMALRRHRREVHRRRGHGGLGNAAHPGGRRGASRPGGAGPSSPRSRRSAPRSARPI